METARMKPSKPQSIEDKGFVWVSRELVVADRRNVVVTRDLAGSEGVSLSLRQLYGRRNQSTSMIFRRNSQTDIRLRVGTPSTTIPTTWTSATTTDSPIIGSSPSTICCKAPKRCTQSSIAGFKI